MPWASRHQGLWKGAISIRKAKERESEQKQQTVLRAIAIDATWIVVLHELGIKDSEDDAGTWIAAHAVYL